MTDFKLFCLLGLSIMLVMDLETNVLKTCSVSIINVGVVRSCWYTLYVYTDVSTCESVNSISVQVDQDKFQTGWSSLLACDILWLNLKNTSSIDVLSISLPDPSVASWQSESSSEYFLIHSEVTVYDKYFSLQKLGIVWSECWFSPLWFPSSSIAL